MLVVLVLEGLNAADIPDGSPLAASATFPLNPFFPATVMVAGTTDPGARDKEVADAERLKLGVRDGGGAVIASAMFVELE